MIKRLYLQINRNERLKNLCPLMLSQTAITMAAGCRVFF